jgi:hypothetical protein
MYSKKPFEEGRRQKAEGRRFFSEGDSNPDRKGATKLKIWWGS